jgi:hypothetical protein
VNGHDKIGYGPKDWSPPFAFGFGVPRRAASHVEIDLPAPALGSEGDADFVNGRRTVPLAVAFSDADDAASGQQTVIATSPLRWNRRNSP